MASASTSIIEQQKQTIENDGFFYQADSVIGKRVDEFAKKGYPFKTEEGLDFCKLTALDDKRISELIESFFSWAGLGLVKAFGPDAQRAFCLLDPRDPKFQALVIQLWGTGSQGVFYKRSHHLSLIPLQAPNGLFEMPRDGLEVDTVERTEVDIAVLDARLGFTIVHGVIITLAFARTEELGRWAKMILPNSPNLRKKVETMTNERTGMNFEFQE